MRNISILVDFTSGLNLYPDLRLCNNSVQYEQSIARISSVLTKMTTPVNASTHTMGQMLAADAVIAMHRAPENGRAFFKSNFTEPNSECANDTLNAFSALAKAFPQITLHLHVGVAGRTPRNMAPALAALERMGKPANIMLAPHVNVMRGPSNGAVLKTHPVGAMFLASEAADEWNAGAKVLSVPLATLTATERSTMAAQVKRSLAANAAEGLARPWLVVDAALPTSAEDAEYGEVAVIEAMLAH